MNFLQELLNTRVADFMKSRNRPVGDLNHLRRSMRAMNEFYWQRAKSLIEEAEIGNDRLHLSEDDQLLLNAGVLDPKLLGDDEACLATVREELEFETSENIFYMSEWLEHRVSLDKAFSAAEMGNEVVGAKFRKHPDYEYGLEIRRESLEKLKHLIQSLPGIPKNIFDIFMSGRLMSHLEDIHFKQVSGQGEPSVADVKLQKFFSDVLLRLKERCQTKVLQNTFTEWLKSEAGLRKLVTENAQQAIESKIKIEQQETVSPDDRESMLKNVKLVRSLIPLGVATSDLNISFSPLFADLNRCTKPNVLKHLEQLREADPLLPGNPDLLVAPYAGNGFFEWDNNTLVLPLTTEHSTAMALVNAVASYRIMTDAMNFEGQLHKAWTDEFGSENFKQNFSEAYHNWVLGVGYGRQLAIPSDQFEFFIKNIGPSPRHGIGPANLLKLDSEGQIEALKVARSRVNANEATYDDLYTLAVIHWRRHNLREAYQCMSDVAEKAPHNPCVLFSTGYLAQQTGRDGYIAFYTKVIKEHPRTIWKVYASIQMDDDRL